MNGGALSSLKAFARGTPAETCGLCSAALSPTHVHLLNLRRRVLECACPPCALLFERAEGGPFRRVTPLAEALPGFRLDDATWESLGIPIGLAYFVRRGPAGEVSAYYPSAAGAVESLLPLSTWRSLQERNPVLGSLAPEVEALLVNRLGGARECFRVSIDECFALTGLVRTRWRGFTGGAEVREALGAFFGRLRGGGALA